jgi:hypothetical protein
MTESQDKVQRCFDLTGEIAELEAEREQLERELSPEEIKRLQKLLRAEGERRKEAAANLAAYRDVKQALGEL